MAQAFGELSPQENVVERLKRVENLLSAALTGAEKNGISASKLIQDGAGVTGTSLEELDVNQGDDDKVLVASKTAVEQDADKAPEVKQDAKAKSAKKAPAKKDSKKGGADTQEAEQDGGF